MYSLDCSYYTAEFETIDELIEAEPIHAAATPFSLPSKSIYKTLRKSGEHGVNIRKNIKKLLKIN
jgi:hypothetical protein